MGKQTYLGILGAALLAVIAYRADPKDALIIALAAFVIVIVIAVLNYRYAHQHPIEAMIEGGEMLALQQHLAAKGLSSPPESGFRAGPLAPNGPSDPKAGQ